MQISRITKANVEKFAKEMSLDDSSNFIKNCELIEYYQLNDVHKVYLGFVIDNNENEKCISIIFINKDLIKSELLKCIKLIKKFIGHNFYLTVYDDNLVKMLENEFSIIKVDNKIGYNIFSINN